MVGLKDVSVFFKKFVINYNSHKNMRNQLPLTQPVSFISLIWHHVLTSDGHLQTCSIKHTKGIAYTCINPFSATG
jgi:hypothetical protein